MTTANDERWRRLFAALDRLDPETTAQQLEILRRETPADGRLGDVEAVLAGRRGDYRGTVRYLSRAAGVARAGEDPPVSGQPIPAAATARLSDPPDRFALRALRPELSLVGVQAAACAPLAGRVPIGPTIADGIAVKHPAELTSGILRDLLDDMVVVDDAAISQALVLLLERSKLVVEGAGAAPVAALLQGLVAGDDPACAVLAGGNIDATTLVSVTRFGLTSSGRYLVVAVLIPDRPGQLAGIVAAAAGLRANVLSVTHHREGRNIGVLETEVELTLETRGEEHSQELVASLAAEGFAVRRLT